MLTDPEKLCICVRQRKASTPPPHTHTNTQRGAPNELSGVGTSSELNLGSSWMRGHGARQKTLSLAN